MKFRISKWGLLIMCGFCWGTSRCGGVVKKVSFAVKLVEPFMCRRLLQCTFSFLFVLSAGGVVVICGH